MDIVAKPQQTIENCQLPIAGLNIDNVKFDNCKDTTIGPKVDCQGDLIVNQFVRVNGVEEFTNLKALKELLIKDSTNNFTWKNFFYSKLIITSICLAALIVVSTLFAVKSFNATIKDIEDTDILPWNFTARFRTRGMWSANEVDVESKELRYHPARYVIVCHTAGPNCEKPMFCDNVVKGIQSYHLNLGYNDIAYNFLIGGDGYIYEGLGWGKYGSHTFGMNCNSIGIAFIGDYDTLKLKQQQVNAFNILIEEALKKEELVPDYKLFANQQISNNASPGLNIMSVLRSWNNSAVVTKEDVYCNSAT